MATYHKVERGVSGHGRNPATGRAAKSTTVRDVGDTESRRG